jgi:hypothetical protein
VLVSEKYSFFSGIDYSQTQVSSIDQHFEERIGIRPKTSKALSQPSTIGAYSCCFSGMTIEFLFGVLRSCFSIEIVNR